MFYWILGYLFGSLPFGLWITRLVKNVDIREGGSGHVTTTNTIRQAGFAPGALVLLLDITKGFIPTFLAIRAGLPAWSVALTAGLTVVGHCYPVFANFRGGMGLAATGGALFAANFTSGLIALAFLIAMVLVIRHSARAALFTGLLTPVLFWLLNFRGIELWVMSAAGIVLAIRFADDWKRQYNELWLDREKDEE